MSTTLEKVIEVAEELPTEQQDMLIEIMQKRRIEQRRSEIAEDAQLSLAAFRRGELKPESAEAAIMELRRSIGEKAK